MDLNDKSILYNDATLKEDLQIIKQLVDYSVVGDLNHKSKCVQKIFSIIQTKEWQEKYPTRIFVFLAQYSTEIKILDVKTMMICGVLEILYYLYFGNDEKYFKNKIIKLYNKFYALNFNSETAEILRIIRNNIAHLGSIDGIEEKYTNEEKTTIYSYKKKFKTNLHIVSHSFNLLVRDMVIRALGLEFEDLSLNGLQAYNFDIFRKITHI